MSNSSLVSYTKISPNSSARTAKISKITIHHMAGNLSVESCAEVFQNTSRQASSNYGIGSDGRIGLYVDESRRAWTSSNRNNDNVAVTIEVANNGGSPNWPISDKALAATIDLCVDICKRNGIKALNFTGDKSGNLTMHKWFANTQCPGPYLESKFSYIASEVNKRLGSEIKTEPEIEIEIEESNYTIKITEIDNYVYNESGVKKFLIKPGVYTIVEEKNGFGKLKSGAGWVKLPEQSNDCSYLVQVKRTDLNIRSGPGTEYSIRSVIKPGVYTIVEEQNNFGKLKSGAGWIALDYTVKL